MTFVWVVAYLHLFYRASPHVKCCQVRVMHSQVFFTWMSQSKARCPADRGGGAELPVPTKS